MRYHAAVAATSLCLLSFSLADDASIATAKPKCKEVAFPLSASAYNFDLSGLKSVNLTNATALGNAIGGYINSGSSLAKTLVSGNDTIAGWYCEPAVRNANNRKLQFFQSSITNNRDSFTAQGGTSLGPGLDASGPVYPPYQPENYDWVLYATRKGYATLTLDHLGNGKTSKPDPILLAQLPYELELLHALVGQIKAGTTKQLPRAYYDLIFVSNSYGSVIGNNFASVYPDDFCQMVLTGFSKSILPSLPGVSLLLPAPAALAYPARFGDLPLGYVAPTDKNARTNSFFGSHEAANFDQQVADIFEERLDVVSLGQFVSTYVAIVPAPKYKGRVLTLTGEHDQAFCGPGSYVIGPAHCGDLLKNTGALFPKADYNWYSVAQSGHALILHLSHAETLDVAHRFLAGEHFEHTAPAGS